MFITRVPSPSWVDLHPGYLMMGMSYFPVAGSVLGLIYAIVFDFVNISLDLPASIAASCLVIMGLYMTGCFHEDGLADSADGLGGGWSKSQVLKIMTDSRVGTFGCAALGMFLLIKVQLLDVLGGSHWQLFECSGAGPAIVVSQTVARLSAPYLIRTRDYIAEVGPKSPFYIFMVDAKCKSLVVLIVLSLRSITHNTIRSRLGFMGEIGYCDNFQSCTCLCHVWTNRFDSTHHGGLICSTLDGK